MSRDESINEARSHPYVRFVPSHVEVRLLKDALFKVEGHKAPHHPRQILKAADNG